MGIDQRKYSVLLNFDLFMLCDLDYTDSRKSQILFLIFYGTSDRVLVFCFVKFAIFEDEKTILHGFVSS